MVATTNMLTEQVAGSGITVLSMLDGMGDEDILILSVEPVDHGAEIRVLQDRSRTRGAHRTSRQETSDDARG